MADSTAAAAAAPPAAAGQQAPDALQLALYALLQQRDKVAYDGKGLVDGGNGSSTTTPPAVLATVGCRSLAVLVHNNAPNKLEAVDRGALRAISRCLSAPEFTLEPAVVAAAAKALKAASFKCEPARQAAADVRLIVDVLAAVERATDLLDYVARRDQSRAATLAGVESCDLAGALPALDELLTALASLVNGHEGCKMQAAEAGAVDAVKRSMAVLASLGGAGKWPPAARPADAAPIPPELALPASGPGPMDVVRKATFLLALLQ